MLPFFKAIFDNNVAFAQGLIARDPQVAAAARWNGHTALQIAAKQGCREIVLCLLSHGAPVDAVGNHQETPFYDAIKYGHTLVAQILLACGASQDRARQRAQELNQERLAEDISGLTVNAAIIRNILLWSANTVYNVNYLFDQIKPHLDLLSNDERVAIVEVMTLKRGEVLAPSQMSTLVGADFCNDSRLTPGYWVASKAERSDPLIFHGTINTVGLANVCHSDKHWKATLQQLRYLNRRTYNYFFSADAAIIGKTFAQLREWEDSFGPVTFLSEVSTSRQRFYQRLIQAQFADVAGLLSAENAEEDQYEVCAEAIICAFEKNNFVTLRLCKELTNIDNEVLLARFLRKNQHDLALSWLMCSGIELANFLLHFPGDNLIINQVALWEKREGLAYTLISSRMGINGFVTKEAIQLLDTLGQTKEQKMQQVAQALQSRYQFLQFSARWDSSDGVCIVNTISPSVHSTAALYYLRLRLIVRSASSQPRHAELCKDVLKYGVTPFLTSRERLVFSLVSRSSYEPMYDSASLNRQLARAKMQLEKLSRFIQLAKAHVNKNRNINGIISLFMLPVAVCSAIALSALIFGIMPVFAVVLVSGSVFGAITIVEEISRMFNRNIVSRFFDSIWDRILYGPPINWLSQSLNKSPQPVQEAAKDVFANFSHESSNGFKDFQMSSPVISILNTARQEAWSKAAHNEKLEQLQKKERLVLQNNSMQRNTIVYAPLPRLGLFALSNDNSSVANVHNEPQPQRSIYAI
jgi:hypothetical protein